MIEQRHRRACAVASTLLTVASCAQPSGHHAILEPSRVSSIIVGRSSKSDVLTALGKPSRVDRNGQGETWVYEYRPDGSGRQTLLAGAQAASAVAGAFVPFVGLLGTGVGLASAADGGGPEPGTTTLAINFADFGIVRECTYSTSMVPADSPTGANAGTAPDCQRPKVPAFPPAR